jgi:hypothetical protein
MDMRPLVVAVLLLAVAGCSHRDDPAAVPTPEPAATTGALTAVPTATPTPTVSANGGGWLRGWLAKEPHSYREFTGRRTPRGVVLCGADVVGHGPGELYVWAQCGDYRPGPDAEELSGSALPAVVRAHRILFPRQQHLDEDIDRLFPADVAQAIRARDVHPTPTADQLLALARKAFGGPKCDAAQLTAEQPDEGGPAAGTFYTGVLVTNTGPDCELLADDLVVWAGAPARSRAPLDVTGNGPVVLMPTGHRLRTLVYVPNQRCFGAARGPSVSLALSVASATQPQVLVTGSGVPAGYERCAGVGFTTVAGRRARPSP